MDRRKFLRQTGTLIAGAAIAPYAFPENNGQAAAMPTGRLVLPMNRKWRYSRTVIEAGHAKDFDDSGFDRVVIPHTNIRLPWHGFDEKTYEFVSLYRRRFKLPPEARGKRVFVDFEGVMTASTVWINGVKLGEYKGGYTPFSFELTSHVDFDGENVLAVDVDSSERPDIPPFGYEIDYLTFGGIYREVSLRVVPTTFIENIFVRPKNVLTATPGLDVDCFVQHLDASHDSLTLEVELLDGERAVAKASQPLPSSGASSEAAAHTLHLEGLSGIKLWSMEDRNLYSCACDCAAGRNCWTKTRGVSGFARRNSPITASS
ncbi:MAG: sugar-binding domain-containing protein [Candidatus Sulfotelmatobacter sp.]